MLSFARYAALVKNLRGVVLFDVDDDYSWNRIRWLVRRFRYRNLGLPPLVAETSKGRLDNYLNGKPFHILYYPVEDIKKLTTRLSSHIKKAPIECIESLILASTYISPLLVIGRKYSEILGAMAVETIRACKDMDDRSWKLHLRIADYTILDFYQQAVLESYRLIDTIRSGKPYGSLLDEIIESRISRIRKDVKRYWRISCGKGVEFMYYIDLLLIAQGVLPSLSGDHAAALAIVPAVIL